MDSRSFKFCDTIIDLYNGDCLDIIPLLNKHSVDLIAVDPPYGTTQNKWDVVIPLDDMWECIKYILKPNGNVVFTATQPFSSMLILSNLDWYKYDLVWMKTIGSGQLNISKQPLRVHEGIIIFYNKFGTYNEQKTEGKPYSISRKTSNFEGNYGRQKDHLKINDGFRHAKSIVKIPNPRIKGGHRTEKPVKLMEYIINTYSNTGDVVLDFSMGRVTTGIACMNLGRSFVGIEKDQLWFSRSVDRVSEYVDKFKLFC